MGLDATEARNISGHIVVPICCCFRSNAIVLRGLRDFYNRMFVHVFAAPIAFHIRCKHRLPKQYSIVSVLSRIYMYDTLYIIGLAIIAYNGKSLS